MHSRVYITLKQNGTHNVLRPHVERHVGHDRALSASAPRSDAGGVEAGGFGFSSEAGVHPNAHGLEPSGPRHRVAA